MASVAMSVQAEGRIEGLHAADEFKEEQLAILNSEENQRQMEWEVYKEIGTPELIPMYDNEGNFTGYEQDPEYAKKFEEKYNERMQRAMDDIEKNSRRVAVNTFAMNAPILAISNVWQFGSLYRKN
jgi:abortive infection bacteriophage resistance protein